ncbi:hypothetical protein OKW50_005929 [Paraburkholderia youngii]|uniref:Uncharacterized protein n=1 Tax=Paraburkholderia youngii TaxID=2782701 RepID=A0A7W8L2H0_9BURK|nr:hypothetical protein [Paraburkholderia youngii]
MTAVFFLNRWEFNPGEKKLPVFSGAENEEEGFPVTGGH